MSVVVVPQGEAWLEQAQSLAQRLHIPCAPHRPAHGLVLELGPAGLSLRDADTPREHPLYVNFDTGRMGYRQREGFRRDELLARAAGLKGGQRPGIFDATAGLGRDAFMLASLGCEVTLCERHPVVHALLEDGLHRAAQSPALAPVIARMRLVAGEARVCLGALEGEPPEVILLDPMFPERHKTALVKKPMRLFHGLVGADADADGLLAQARSKARRRVVVKRPLHAPPLAGVEPHLSYRGKAVRFDVYLPSGG